VAWVSLALVDRRSAPGKLAIPKPTGLGYLYASMSLTPTWCLQRCIRALSSRTIFPA